MRSLYRPDEGGEEELLSAHDWSQNFPPLLLQALLPELQKLALQSPSPQALLTPQILKLIYEKSSSIENTPYKSEIVCNRETSSSKTDINDDEPSATFKVSEDIVNSGKENTSTNLADYSSIADEKSKNTLTILVPNPEDVIITDTDSTEITTSFKCDYTHVNEIKEVSNEEIDECFDAVEATLSVKVDPRICQDKDRFKSSNSLESVASSGDQQYEDTLDVSVGNENESESTKDRGGKYKKGRAPLPPGVIFTEDSEDTIQLPTIKTINSEPVQSTTSNIQSNFMDTVNDNYVKERSVSPSWSKKDRSPSPKQAKKDSSNFSRFLPKAGVSSLFNFLSTKDESGSVNRASVSRSSSNASRKSPTSKFFSSSDSSNIVPTMYFNETGIGSQNNEKGGTHQSNPKLKLRQMSQSPSRRRQKYD